MPFWRGLFFDNYTSQTRKGSTMVGFFVAVLRFLSPDQIFPPSPQAFNDAVNGNQPVKIYLRGWRRTDNEWLAASFPWPRQINHEVAELQIKEGQIFITLRRFLEEGDYACLKRWAKREGSLTGHTVTIRQGSQTDTVYVHNRLGSIM